MKHCHFQPVMDLVIERRDIIVIVIQLIGMGSLPATYLKQCRAGKRKRATLLAVPSISSCPPAHHIVRFVLLIYCLEICSSYRTSVPGLAIWHLKHFYVMCYAILHPILSVHPLVHQLVPL